MAGEAAAGVGSGAAAAEEPGSAAGAAEEIGTMGEDLAAGAYTGPVSSSI